MGEKYNCRSVIRVLSGLLVPLLVSCGRGTKNPTICDIQGDHSGLNYIGQMVQLEGILSADLLSDEPPGFFLEENCPEELSSAAIWVILGARPDWLSVGDRIRVNGVVGEVDGETLLDASIQDIKVLSVGEQLVEPADLEQLFLQDPFKFSYESLEGRIVHLAAGLVLLSSPEGKDLVVCPVFSSSEPWGEHCRLGQHFYLGIKGSLNHPGLHAVQGGDRIVSLMGVLRQGLAGYYIQVLDPAGIKVQIRNLSGGTQAGIFKISDPNGIPSGESSPTPNNFDDPLSQTFEPSGTATPRPSPTWYPVPLLISEILPDPDGKEPNLEWVEIYNPAAYGVPLSGIKLGDAQSRDGKEGMLIFPNGWYIESGEVLVIANQAADFRARYGFYPDFELRDSTGAVPDLLPYDGWGGNKVQFSNSGDEVLLLDPWDQIVDQLAFGKSTWSGFSSPAPAPGEGNSLERYPPGRDRDQAGDWRVMPGGSPGWLDRSPPTAIASRTLSPTASFTSSPSSSPVGPENTASPTASPSGPTASQQNVTLTPSPVLPTLPLFTVSPSQTAPLPTGTHPTPSITDPILPSTTNTSWPSASPGLTSSPTATSSGAVTPSPQISSTPSPAPTSPPLILINEIHADPHPTFGDANQDGVVDSDDDEFLELVNPGTGVLDLSGWWIEDLVRPRFSFPESTYLKAGCGLVIFGGEQGEVEISGSLVFSAGSLALNNGGDTISIRDADGNLVLETSYGPEGGLDQSLARYPDIRGGLPLVLHGEIPEAVGLLFSPGRRVDGSEFGECP